MFLVALSLSSTPIRARLQSTDLHDTLPLYEQKIPSVHAASHHCTIAFSHKRRVHFILSTIGLANLQDMYHCILLAFLSFVTGKQ